jgi:hypothetical protein
MPSYRTVRVADELHFADLWIEAPRMLAQRIGYEFLSMMCDGSRRKDGARRGPRSCASRRRGCSRGLTRQRVEPAEQRRALATLERDGNATYIMFSGGHLAPLHPVLPCVVAIRAYVCARKPRAKFRGR